MQPDVLVKYYELDLVDRTVVDIVEKLEGEISPSDINRVHPHAIVAGKHPLASATRLVMAKLGIRIDDVDNRLLATRELKSLSTSRYASCTSP